MENNGIIKVPTFLWNSFFLILFRLRILINWLKKDLILYCWCWISYGWISYFLLYFTPGSINQTRIVSTTIFPIIFLGTLALEHFIKAELQYIDTSMKHLKGRYLLLLSVLVTLSCFPTISAVKYKYAQPTYLSYAEYEACIWLKNNSSPEAIVIVPQGQNSPIPVFGERRILITYGYFMDGYSLVGAGWSVYVTNTVYSTENITYAYVLAKKSNVQYIYINAYAREYYPSEGLKKFFRENPFFEKVYENSEVVLISVKYAK